ncbi:DUF6912 family protein [Ornithinimicrobium flavum]|uniref:DUF6912 family protein n=1 Tax=Ornithinimicrobium flavum TaxID=1288636 RepID=UPI00106FA2ED|nr:hypothetical protein [Ornithinimicrobium flavum]
MTTVRCYVPLSAEQLSQLHDERRLPGPLRATAVTRSVRASQPGADSEEWEHVAIQAAARGLVADGLPVIVAAVDLVDTEVDATRAEGPQVRVGEVILPRVAALHVGDDVVTSDPSTLPPPGGEEEIELSWYDTTEIAHVVELVAALVTGAQDQAPLIPPDPAT